MAKNKDTEYMELALKLARRAADRTYPNPMVGALIVKGGRILGKGYHRRPGEDHAEIRAIKDASGKCKGSVMYVTLEPCDHYGKTPPCTKAIIESGVKKVVMAMKDPNPLNSGRGTRALKKAGIRVTSGVCAKEAAALNKKYIKFITTGMPYVTLKLAQSVDGKIAAADGSSKWITSEASRRFAKKMRADFNAIMVGANTAVMDDPLLLGEGDKGHRIKRVIVDSRLRLPLGSKLIMTARTSPVIIATTELAPASRKKKLLEIEGVEIIETKSTNSKVRLKTLLKKLAAKGIVNLLIEGGGELAGSFIDQALADEVMFFIAPKVIGGSRSSVKGRGAGSINTVIELEDMKVKNLGQDIIIRGSVCSRG